MFQVIDDCASDCFCSFGARRRRIRTSIQQYIDGQHIQKLDLKQARPTMASRSIAKTIVSQNAKLLFFDSPVIGARVASFDRVEYSILNIGSEAPVITEIDIDLR